MMIDNNWLLGVPNEEVTDYVDIKVRSEKVLTVMMGFRYALKKSLIDQKIMD